MEVFIEKITGIFFLSGVIFLVAGIILYSFPPKKINHLYGYRTKRSMNSQEAWDFAQKDSAKQMFKAGVIMIILGVVTLLAETNEVFNLIAGLAALIGSAVYVLYFTEKKLKDKFEKI